MAGERKVVEGVCSEISERGGWTTFHIDVGSQWPVKLATKRSEIIEAGREANSQNARMSWHYTESESDRINEHSGKPYINRYLEEVDATVSGDGKRSSNSSGAQKEEVDWDGKDRRIARQNSVRNAAMIAGLLEVGPNEDAVSSVLAAAARFERWIYRDFDQLPSASGAETSQPGAYDEPLPADVDDGIPF